MDMEQRLFELRLKMNKAKQLNNQAVIAEKKRQADPKHHTKEPKNEEGEPEVVDPAEKLLHVTAETASSKTKKRGPQESFAWDAYNSESLYRAHDKRVNKMGFYPDAYERQKELVGEETFFEGSSNAGHKPSEESKARLADALKDQQEQRKKFSRRRVFDEDEEVQWINDRNKQFTKKLDRAFGEHTKQIKSNLERGTAI